MSGAVKKRAKRNPEQTAGYLLIAPAYILYLVFILIPIGWTIAMSFTDYNFSTANFVWFSNYVALLQDAVFLKSVGNTILFGLYTILPTMVIGLGLAVLLNNNIAGKGIFRTVFYLPNIISMVAVSMAWLYLMDTNAGLFNTTLRMMGLDAVQWLSDPALAMISVAITSIWATVGYNMVIFLAGLQAIPQDLYEAASIDGVGKWGQFRFITVPLLAPSIFFVFVNACIRSFQVFGQVLIMTGGGPVNSTTTIAHQIYSNGFLYYKMGYASSQAVILLLIVLVITMINFKYGKGNRDELS